DEIKVKNLGDTYSFGFPLYAVGQTADILAFRPVGVPVGEDQVPHLELTREVARRFNQMYCGVGDKVEDDDHVAEGGVFPVPRADVGKVGRLVGIDGENKMSKSLNNAVFISDTAKQVQKKINKIYTGRQSATEPGDPTNVLMQYCEIFIPDEERVAELRRRYAAGDDIGDGHIKQELGAAVNELLEPMRERRARFENDSDVIDVLKRGTVEANRATEETLAMAKQAAGLGFFPRTLRLD
ncbi:MAG: tryptophan--tRNA ligase, partial [Planctomycetota bacterium]|nr:tryptophan--tRNA ligase [Planctomycetota bacterium]